MKKLLFITSVLALGLFAQKSQAQDIVDVAASVEDFSTLVTAVKAADLVGALKGDGPLLYLPR